MDDYLEAQEASIDKLYGEKGNYQQWIDASTNYDSIFAMEVIKAKSEIGMTLADKVARGAERVIEAREKMMNSERLVKAGKAKIQYLQNRYEADKARMRSEGVITR